MRIAWYTPFSAFSAIGAFSREVLPALQRMGHDVVIVRCEGPSAPVAVPHLTSGARVVTAHEFNEDVEGFLEDFDVVIYNLGNHFHNHYFAIEHQKKVPGVTILHDYLLHHLLAESCAHSESLNYEQVLQTEASNEAVDAFRTAAAGDIQSDWYMSKACEYPVLRFAVANALGVVTHARFYEESTRQKLHCPVKAIPLAYPQQTEQKMELPLRRPGKLRLLTIGDVNVNKRCESIVRAIGKNQWLAENWEYRIAGSVTKHHREHLMQLAHKGPWPVELHLLGKVDDDTLKKEVTMANAISCLRYPIIEGASASVIVALASGRPTLVSEGGCYAEIPDALIYRISMENETADISLRLAEILGDYNLALRKSAAARQWAEHRHSGQAYADQLIPFLQSVLKLSPLIHLTDRIGQVLAAWQCPSDAVVTSKVDRVLNELFPSIMESESRHGV